MLKFEKKKSVAKRLNQNGVHELLLLISQITGISRSSYLFSSLWVFEAPTMKFDNACASFSYAHICESERSNDIRTFSIARRLYKPYLLTVHIPVALICFLRKKYHGSFEIQNASLPRRISHGVVEVVRFLCDKVIVLCRMIK